MAQYQPQTIEVSKRFDIKTSKTDSSQAHAGIFATDDSVLRGLLGISSDAVMPSLRIFWHRFLQFVQDIEFDEPADVHMTGEVERHYSVESK